MKRSFLLLLLFPWQLWAQSSQPAKIGIPTLSSSPQPAASQPVSSQAPTPHPEATSPITTEPTQSALSYTQPEPAPQAYKPNRPQLISLLAAPAGIALTGVGLAAGDNTNSLAVKGLSVGLASAGLAMMVVGPSYSHIKAKEWRRVAGFSALRVSAAGVGSLGVALAAAGLVLPIADGLVGEGKDPGDELTFADTRGVLLTGAALTVAGVALFAGVRAWVFADGERALKRAEAK